MHLRASSQADGKHIGLAEWQLSPDMKYMLIKTDYSKQWRHSSFGNYYIHDIAERKARPVIPPSYPPTTAFAKWSPTGEAIAFVKSNDVYILPDASCVHIFVTIYIRTELKVGLILNLSGSLLTAMLQYLMAYLTGFTRRRSSVPTLRFGGRQIPAKLPSFHSTRLLLTNTPSRFTIQQATRTAFTRIPTS